MADCIVWTEEQRKLRDLQPWERSPRQITREQADRLVESFDEFGQVETMAIGPDNQIYNGHQRLSVLRQKYGDDYEVDVRVASRPLTEKEREKLTVFLHKGAAGERLARRVYAIELEPRYVAVALQRWADTTGKTPMLAEPIP